MGETVRMDKWLWAARFFKTRALAARACDLGRIEAGTAPAKPARPVHAGERLRITTEGGTYEIDVLVLSEVRGPAVLAKTLYTETESSRAARELAAAERKVQGINPGRDAGRPSKRDRRRIVQFRGKSRGL